MPELAGCPGCGALDYGYTACRACQRPLREVDLPSAGTPQPRVSAVAEQVVYEHVNTPDGWYILRGKEDKEQYWTREGWVGKPRRRGYGTPTFPGHTSAVPRTQPVARGSQDGTKTCPMCAEQVQAAAVVCRFCGHRFDGRAAAIARGETSTSGAAIAAFICSIVGLWIASIPLGIYAQRQIDESGGRKTGRGFATAGIVLGIIGIVGTIILIIALISAAKHTPSCTLTYNATGECVPGS